MYASCSGRHDVGQGNVNILQHLYSNVTNLHQLTSHMTTCPTT